MREMLATALRGGYAVGYFEAWDQYSIEAVLEAAEESGSPVILGFGGMMMNQEWFGAGGLCALGAMGRAIAEGSHVPVSYLLNEVEAFEHIERGLTSGFNAVMLDTSHLPLERNIDQTRRVVEAARQFGADVEGECDPLPDASGATGAHAPPRLTEPAEAARYVAETGVCALSISVGNEHIRTTGESGIDLERLVCIREAVAVPLVIHGGTGFPDSAVQDAIRLGVAKFNVGTVLKRLFHEGVREGVLSLPEKIDFQEVVGSRKHGDVIRHAMERVGSEVARRMAVYGSAKRS